MRWVYERENGATICMFALHQNDIPAISRAIQKPLEKLRTEYDKLKDIHEIGEATDKQTTKMSALAEEIETLEYFLKESAK